MPKFRELFWNWEFTFWKSFFRNSRVSPMKYYFSALMTDDNGPMLLLCTRRQLILISTAGLKIIKASACPVLKGISEKVASLPVSVHYLRKTRCFMAEEPVAIIWSKYDLLLLLPLSLLLLVSLLIILNLIINWFYILRTRVLLIQFLA